MGTPRLLVSSCLAGICCRYDGRTLPDPVIVDAVARGDALPVCAEVLGGLATPRVPAEIVGGDGASVLAGSARVLTRDGLDVTDAFVSGAELAADQAERHGIRDAVLQALSPSCGCGQIYDGTFSGRTVAGDGVLAALLTARGLTVTTRRGSRHD